MRRGRVSSETRVSNSTSLKRKVTSLIGAQKLIALSEGSICFTYLINWKNIELQQILQAFPMLNSRFRRNFSD